MRPRLDVWSYTSLVGHIADGTIRSASLLPDASLRILDVDGAQHASQLLPLQVTNVMDALASNNVDVSIVTPTAASFFLRQVLDLFPILIIGFLFLSITQQQGGGGVMNMLARMNPKGSGPDVVDNVETTFDDVAGLTTAKEELEEVVTFLRDPSSFTACGARSPKGVLLEGPPGTGKTLLARAVAGEANASFIPVTASSFVEMYVGLGAARVRSLFVRARERSPCIVWIDEIDAVARKRSGPSSAGGGGNEERESTLNELLSAMDGFSPSDGVIVLAATNRADVLDDALLRPGRFDRRVPVTLPDTAERESILRVHSRNKVLDGGVDLASVARQTTGFSGAELSNLMNEAAIRTVRRRDTTVTQDDIVDALERVTVGLPRSSALSTDVRERVAVHEMGHAIVGTMIEEYDDVLRVTIVPRTSGAGGFTSFTSQEHRGVDGLYTKDYLMAQLAVLLAGRAAEALVLGEKTVSVGASGDIQRAQQLSEQMVMEWGMGQRIPPKQVRGSETLTRIDAEVEHLMDDAYTMATSLLNSQRAALLSLTQDLLEQETMDGERVRQKLR